MQDIFSTRSRAQFVETLSAFLDSMAVAFPECDTTRAWIEGMRTRAADPDRCCLDWREDAERPLPRGSAKWQKAVASIVDGVTDSPTLADEANQRSLLVAMSEEWRVALVKLVHECGAERVRDQCSPARREHLRGCAQRRAPVEDVPETGIKDNSVVGFAGVLRRVVDDISHDVRRGAALGSRGLDHLRREVHACDRGATCRRAVVAAAALTAAGSTAAAGSILL